MLLSKDQILQAQDTPYEDVNVPEWGGAVRIGTMTGEGRDRYEQSIFDMKKKGVTLDNIRAKLIAASAIDESGNLMFSEEDIQALGKKSAKALDRLFAVAQRLNGVTDADVEELAKNSEGDRKGGSTSGSPKN